MHRRYSEIDLNYLRMKLELKKNVFASFAEPFDRSNTARSCCNEKIFERIKKIFSKSWHLLRETKELESLFGEVLVPHPQIYNTFYDNNHVVTPVSFPPMGYPQMRTN